MRPAEVLKSARLSIKRILMDKKKGSRKQKLILLTVSCFFVMALLGIGEIYCRLFTRINFLDNSRGLFEPGRFGNTYGNTPNYQGISFGEAFYTDANGFRVHPGSTQHKGSDRPAILVMGDSVAFGPTLTENQTISGVLRRSVPDASLYNAAAIGYDTFDYRNAVQGIVSEHPEVSSVLLFFCLNDVTDSSAQLIRSQTIQQEPEQSVSASIPRRVNDFLRSRSKFYLWLKNALVDTQMVHFKNDLGNYQRGEKNVHDALMPVIELSRELKSKGIGFKVFVTPYEAQLRPGTPVEYLLPQKMVADFLAMSGIENYDTTAEFQKSSEPQMLFLYGDPMHLSAEGTKLVADFVCGKLPECKQ